MTKKATTEEVATLSSLVRDFVERDQTRKQAEIEETQRKRREAVVSILRVGLEGHEYSLLAEELEPLGLQFRLWWNGTAYYLGYGTKGSEYAEAYIMTEGGGKQRIASGADLMLFLGGI